MKARILCHESKHEIVQELFEGEIVLQEEGNIFSELSKPSENFSPGQPAKLTVQVQALMSALRFLTEYFEQSRLYRGSTSIGLSI